jgi:hypothetical protein
MPFIGNQPALSYTSFAKQDFTTSATTSYTLDHPVTNENEIALFINFVRQEPTTAYTATNTTLTLTSATSASDDMYCVFLGKAIQTVNPPSGSVGLSQLSATGTKNATTFLRGDNTFASAGGANTPAFKAYYNGSQTISNNTTTKITQYGTEEYDTDNAFASSRFTVPSGKAGKYIFFATLSDDTGSSSTNTFTFFFKKNGSADIGNTSAYLTAYQQMQVFAVDDLAVGDYVEVYLYQSSGGNLTLDGNERVFFSGFRLIE